MNRASLHNLRVTRNRILRALALSFGFSVLFLVAIHPGNVRNNFPESTIVFDRNDTVLRITTALDARYRIWNTLGDYSPYLLDALLTKEDRSFWVHPGIDVPALFNAAWHSFIVHDYRAGASTITMQLARLVWKLDTDRIDGKLVQILRALQLSLFFHKTQVLELYANLAPCGGNIEGFGTASRIFFAKPVGRLNFAEALALAVIPQDPGRRNPADTNAIPVIRAARDLLFTQMLDLQPSLANMRGELDLPIAFRRELPFRTPHLAQRLLTTYPHAHQIKASVDLRLQSLLERVVGRFVESSREVGITNASALLVRADTMEILASLGSAAFADESISGQVDGTVALRSPGSTLKPFIYALAMDQGLLHPYTMLKDARVHFGGYNPDNFDNDFLGPVRAADALILSRNIPAVSIAGALHNPDLYNFLQQAGVNLPYPREHYGLSIVLGGAEVTMEQLVQLYGVLANGGVLKDLRVATSVDSRTIPQISAPKRLVSPEAAWLVRQILAAKPKPEDAGTYASRENTLEEVADAVAYKTGTSIGFRDAWSIGIFDGLILAVWVGDFKGTGNPEFIGLRTAAPLMFSLIDALRSSHQADEFVARTLPKKPDGIVRADICAISGQLAGPLCTERVSGYFIAGVSPINLCTVHQSFPIDHTTGLRRSQDMVGITHRETFEIWPADIMDIFAKAGLMRRVPPALDPRDTIEIEATKSGGPTIIVPIAGIQYYIDISEESERIPFISALGSDSHGVWWFLDGALAGKSEGRVPFFWKPIPGEHVLKAIDDAGRSDQKRFTVMAKEHGR